MIDDKRATPPPLDAWVYAGAILAAVILALLPISATDEVRKPNSFVEYNSARIAEAADSRRGGFVILLGNSKLKYATDIDKIREHYSIENPGKPPSLVRIVYNDAVFADLGDIPETVLGANPDLIIVQADLVLNDRSIGQVLRLLQAYARWRLFPSDGKIILTDINNAALQYETPCRNDFNIERLEKFLLRIANPDTSGSIEHENARAALAFMNRARERNIPVAILPLINHPRAMAEIGNERDLLLERAITDVDVALWQTPMSVGIGSDDFCDFVHLNDAGRTKLSIWLARMIAATLSHV
jgi:hypothetical protein